MVARDLYELAETCLHHYNLDPNTQFANAFNAFEDSARKRYASKHEEFRKALDNMVLQSHRHDLFNLFCHYKIKPDDLFLDKGLIIQIDDKFQFINPIAAEVVWKYFQETIALTDAFQFANYAVSRNISLAS